MEAFREMDFDLAGMELKLQNEQNELEVVAREGVLLEEPGDFGTKGRMMSDGLCCKILLFFEFV